MMELLENFDCANGNNKELSLSSSYDNEQILYRSCLIGDLERVEYLLQNNSSSIDLNRQNANGLTLLHFACTNNFYGLVQLLLQYHANSHIQDHHGRTCLHYASIKGYRAIINLLFQSRTNTFDQQDWILLVDDEKKNSLDYACENDHMDLVEIFLQSLDMDIDLTTSLYYSCLEGHVDICQLLINKQRQRNELFHIQPTFIQSICHRGHIEILRLLISNISLVHQHHPNCRNSILFYCISTLDIDLVKNLLEHQARLTEKDIHDLITFCPLNEENQFYVDHYFNCLELLFRYRINFDHQKICKYFIRQLSEKCTTMFIGKKLKYLFALAIYNGSIPLHRRSTMKWCGEINILTKRYVNLIDVIKQSTQNWSLKHLLRMKIRRSMKIYNLEQLRNLPGLQEHHIRFLSFDYL